MHGRGRGMSWGQPDPMDSFDPMAEAYRDTGFNSYMSGPGSHMNTSMQVEMRRREDGGNFKLYIGNIPPNLNEVGLRNLFSSVGDPLNIHMQMKPNTKFKWGFVEFRTMSEAQRAIFQIDSQPPHFLTVQAAKGENEKAERRRHYEETKPFAGPDDIPMFPGGDRGRGTLPPMRGIHPKNLKVPRMYDSQLYYDQYIPDNGYSVDRFQHYKGDPYLESANEEFSTMTLSVSNDGQRQVVMGRGSYIPDTGDSRRFRPPFYRHRLEEIVKSSINNLYYTSKKDEVFQFSNDDGTLEKINCVKCGSHANRMCCNCKSVYCTHDCMKSDKERHESVCKLQNGDSSNTTPNAHDENGLVGPKTPNSNSKKYEHSSDSENKSNEKGYKQKFDNKPKKNNENKGFGNRNNNKFPKKTFVRGKPVPSNEENESTDISKVSDERSSKASPFDPKKSPSNNEMGKSTLKYPIPEDAFSEVSIILKSENNTFWVQDLNSIIIQAQIVRDLNRYITSGEAKCLSSVYPKAKCAAVFQGDWYRAKIVAVEPQLKVLFVDYGNEEICNPEDLRTLPKDMMTIPPVAFKIRFASESKYTNLLPEDTINVKPISKDTTDVWLVQVEGESYPADTVEIGIPMSCPQPIFENFTKVILAVKDSETEYWVQLASNLKEFYELTKELELCTSVKIVPELGETYAKLYMETWCRAKVIQMNPLKVFYIDYGNYEVVSATDLHPLPATCSSVLPMAFRIKLADGTPSTYFEMNPAKEISVKGIGELEDGTVIVQIEGEAYKTQVPQLEVPRRPKNNERSGLGHVLYMVEPGMKFDLKVQRVVSEDHLTCTILPRDFINSSYLSVNVIAEKLAKIETIPGFKGKLGDMVCIEYHNKRKRGYVMGVWEKEIRVALVDTASVIVVSNCVAPIPKEIQDIPEAGVRCLLDIPIMKGVEMEDLVLNCTAQCYKGNILTVEVEGFGSAEIVPWEPLIEEGGLPTVEITSGTKVLLTAHRTSEAIYVQSNKQEHLEILASLIQDVGAHCMRASPLDRNPLTGELVGCTYIDGNFYRAQVFERVDDEFNVVFTDYGNSEKVSATNMRSLSTSLKLVPCCAVKVGLKDVPRTPFSPYAIKYLNELATTQEELILTYENKNLGEVTLSSVRGASVNKTLAEMAEPSWKKALANNKDPSEGHVFMATNLIYVKWHMKKKLSVMILASASLNIKVAAATTISYINHVASILVEQMSEYCEATPREQSYNPRPNEICIAKFEDGKWYRALCIQSKPTTSELLFIDYGNYGEVLQRNIRCMTPDFISSPAMLKRMKIYGIPDSAAKVVETELSKVLAEGTVHQVVVVDERDDGNVTVWIPSLSNKVVELGLPPISPPPGFEKL